MDTGTLILVVWVGVVFASIIGTAVYFGGLLGAVARCFSSTCVRRTNAVTPVGTLQPSAPPPVDLNDVEKGETNDVSTGDKKITIVVAENIASSTTTMSVTRSS